MAEEGNSGGIVYPFQSKLELENLINRFIDSTERSEILIGILWKLGASAYLIEENYMDKDYIVDYSTFFVRCHREYKRFCKRVHFFSSTEEFQLDNGKLTSILTSNADKTTIDNINSIYLGFIVLKDFKDNWLIGRTCLKHYPEIEEIGRYYPAVRTYQVNLYGIPLSVCSMAFQEQDEATGVCASVALYSALNVTGVMYQHHFPSLSEVTKLCLTESSHSKLTGGLSTHQIAVGVSKMGLHPDIYTPKTDRENKAVIYAYLKAKIPIVCGLWLFNEKNDNTIDYKSLSYHAVTINGYSFEAGKSETSYGDELNLFACRMTRFYVHDDQLGPFVKMNFTYNWQIISTETKRFFKKITTSWKSSNNSELFNDQANHKEHKIARIQSLIVPLETKIRIPYANIETEIKKISTDLREFVESKNYSPLEIEWDIHLSTVNDLKKELLQKQFKDKESVLKTSFAKYLWRAKAIIDNEYVFEIMFDATDSIKSGIKRDVVLYNPKYASFYEFSQKISNKI